MQQSPAIQSPVDSMIDQSLHEYRSQNFLIQSAQQSGQSSSLSLSKMQKQQNPFEGTVYKPFIDRMNDFKIDFHSERKKIMENKKYAKFSREAVNLWTKNDELEQKIKQRQKEVKQSEQEKQRLQKEAERLKAQKRKVDNQKKGKEYVLAFENGLKQKLKDQRVYFRSQEQSSKEAREELSKYLDKRSQVTLERLKPYLQQSDKMMDRENQKIQRDINLMKEQGQRYQEQIIRQQQLIQSSIQARRRNQLYDLKEDQQQFSRGIKKYSERLKQDMKIQKSRQDQQ